MSFFQTLGIGTLIIVACMSALWLVSLRLQDASIVDVFWGLGLVILAGVYFASTQGHLARKGLLVMLVAIWGVRLGAYIASRNLGKGEDKRYQAFRRAGGPNYWWISFFQVFMLQAVLMVLISTPLLAGQIGEQPQRLTLLDFIGTAGWLVALLFEAVGDWQLNRFKADPASQGKVMRRGLWRYTRHPNYFGEAVLWWGYGLIALSAPGGVWTLYSPVVMTFLLVRVSGVTLLEKSLSTTKVGYQDYVETTSAFIPWFPRRKV